MEAAADVKVVKGGTYNRTTKKIENTEPVAAAEGRTVHQDPRPGPCGRHHHGRRQITEIALAKKK